MRTYDFTGWLWGALPYGVVKAARNGNVQGAKVVAKVECVECKRPMWTCDVAREDMCEEDEYLLHSRNRDMIVDRAKRNNMKAINPFADNESVPHSFWPTKDTI